MPADGKSASKSIADESQKDLKNEERRARATVSRVPDVPPQRIAELSHAIARIALREELSAEQVEALAYRVGQAERMMRPSKRSTRLRLASNVDISPEALYRNGAGKFIRVTLARSAIGRPDNHRRIIESLGLRKTQETVIHQDSPSIIGAIKKVPHLLDCEEFVID